LLHAPELRTSGHSDGASSLRRGRVDHPGLRADRHGVGAAASRPETWMTEWPPSDKQPPDGLDAGGGTGATLLPVLEALLKPSEPRPDIHGAGENESGISKKSETTYAAWCDRFGNTSVCVFATSSASHDVRSPSRSIQARI